MLAKYKVLIAGITAFLVAVAGFFLLRPEKPESPAQVAQLHGKRNIMVLGVDRRSGDTGPVRIPSLSPCWILPGTRRPFCRSPGIPWYPFPATAGTR